MGEGSGRRKRGVVRERIAGVEGRGGKGSGRRGEGVRAREVSLSGGGVEKDEVQTGW